MTVAVGCFALALGVILGFLAAARHAEELHQENERLRTVLRYISGVAIRHPDLGRLRRYIERALDDEAGA